MGAYCPTSNTTPWTITLENSECFASKITSELSLLESKNGCTNVTYVHCTCHKKRLASEKKSLSSIRDHSYIM